MSPRTSADDRLRRLLAVIPWVAAHDGPLISEVCERFEVGERELLADLDLLFFCGVYPYSPDVLIEVDVSDDRVWINYADWFRRPLRLTPAEGLALLASGQALLAAPGTDPDGPLAKGLAKVAEVLGVAAGQALDVELGEAPAGVLATLQEAARDRRRVRIDYYSFGRDERTTRDVDPHHVFNEAGAWYLRGHCHLARGERLFRADRVASAELLEAHFDPPAEPATTALYSPRADDPVVVIELAPEARWVCEQYPNEGVESRPDGTARVHLRISERSWLERLLLRLGPSGRVVDGDDVGPAAARRLLERYS